MALKSLADKYLISFWNNWIQSDHYLGYLHFIW